MTNFSLMDVAIRHGIEALGIREVDLESHPEEADGKEDVCVLMTEDAVLYRWDDGDGKWVCWIDSDPDWDEEEREAWSEPMEGPDSCAWWARVLLPEGTDSDAAQTDVYQLYENVFYCEQMGEPDLSSPVKTYAVA